MHDQITEDERKLVSDSEIYAAVLELLSKFQRF